MKRDRETRRPAIRKRLIVALDRPTLQSATKLVDKLIDEVGLFKIGNELFVSAGPRAIRMVRDRGGEVFLDLKFHDIPRTVSAAVIESAKLGAKIVNIHVTGGAEMMRYTMSELTRFCRSARLRRPKVLGVTVLTSLDNRDLSSIGLRASASEQVLRLAKLAKECGLDGIVASPQEIATIRKACGKRFIILTPGVRLNESTAGDQKRIATPAGAIRAGADYLVVGRPIHGAKDPVASTRDVVRSMHAGLKS